MRPSTSLVVAATLLAISVSADVSIDPNASVAALLDLAKTARVQGHNGDALSYLDAAVTKEPSHYLARFQRGATNLASGRNAQAKADFDAAIKIRPDSEGALRQRAKIYARGGEWQHAKDDYKRVGAKATEDLRELEDAEAASYRAFEAEKKKDWEACVNNAGTAILTAGTALSLRQLRARCRFEKGEVQEGVTDLIHVLQIDPGSTEPHLQISSMLFYSLGDTEKALAQVRKCLHSDPESKSCKKLFREEKQVLKAIDKVKGLMEARQFSSAGKALVGTADEPGLIKELEEKFQAGVNAGHIHVNSPTGLYLRHVDMACEAYYTTNTPKKAEPWCKQALELGPESLYSLLFQAKMQLDAEEFDAAIATLNTANDNHPDARIVQEKLQEAQVALKRSKTKDYYKVIGVSRDADEATIKKAYRKATKLYHPDKALSNGITKEEAEKKMAAVNEAYEVLSDPELKARFDRGEDPNDPLANQGGHPFQQGGNPFGGFGGGGQQFFFQQGPGGGKTKIKFGGGGFPGGGFPFGM